MLLYLNVNLSIKINMQIFNHIGGFVFGATLSAGFVITMNEVIYS
jgi:membrane associated rhomboid family serine protease